MTPEYLQFARAVLLWMAKTRFIRWGLYNHLIKDVVRRERIVMGCEGKETFRSYQLAEKVARRGGKRTHSIRRPYHCTVCGYFHVGTDERGRRRAKAQRRIELDEERAVA